jgi:hypothetical protein
MRPFHRVLAFVCCLPLTLAGVVAACSSGITSPPRQACEVNNTAQVAFADHSQSNSTYTIIWDGATLTTVSPGSQSQYYTVAAGVSHVLQFEFTNSSSQACTPSLPTLAQCAEEVYSCTG